jgi:predicted ribosomally synthesized peptide with SipW-like signal peptide
MKKIAMSLSAIAFVAAAAIGATGAFFSDTETSSGNTFTAGAIDLTVDSARSTTHGNLVCSTKLPQVYYRYKDIIDPADAIFLPLQIFLGSPCSGTWAQTNLGATNQFFNFGDVKPGDPGEDTVSLHINNNDAWMYADLVTNSNNENDLIEPEASAGDVTPGPIGGGELAQNLSYVIWRDTASTSGATVGDNIHQIGEPILSGPIFASSLIGATTTLALADSTIGSGPFVGGATNYVGIAWCVGTQTVDGTTGAISCNGASVGNTVQTDSATSTVAFRVVQSRNNPNFTCAAGVAGPTEVDVTANTLGFPNWYFYNDTSDQIDNSLGSFVVGPGSPPHGANSAQMTATSSTSRTLLTNSSYGGTKLGSTTQLAYTEWSQSGGTAGPNEAPFFRFNVDFNFLPGYQNSLVYVPSLNGAIVKDTWQTWNMMLPGSLWLYSGANWPAPNAQPGTTPKTWAQILADYPNIRMHPLFPQLGIRVGEPGPAGYTGNVDSFTIATGGPATTYDFGN